MKKPIQNSAKINMLSHTDRFSISMGGMDIKRRSEVELEIQLPVLLDGLQRVVVNGVVFHRNGSLPEVVRVAPLKFTDEMFDEINDLQRSRYYSATAAIEEVANKYDLNYDSFRRQYYSRGGHKLMRKNI